jgi:hypothetical protein
MSPRQRKFGEGWLTVGFLLVLIAVLQEHRAAVYGTFTVVAAYLWWNREFIREMNRLRPITAMEVLRQRMLWRIVAAVWALAVIAASIYIVYSSSGSLGVPKLWELFAFIAIPVIGPFFVAEVALYHRLGG